MTIKNLIETPTEGSYENIQSILSEYLSDSITIIPQFLFTASDTYEEYNQDATLLVEAIQKYLNTEEVDGLTGACLYQNLCTLESKWSNIDDILDYLKQFLSKNAKTLYEHEISNLNKYFDLLASSLPEKRYLINELVNIINVIPLLDDEHSPKDRFNIVDQLLLSGKMLVEKLKKIENEFVIDGNILKLKYKGQEGETISSTKGLTIIHKILIAGGKEIDATELDNRKFDVIDKIDGDSELETDYDGTLELSDSRERDRLERIISDIQDNIKDAEERVDENELVKLRKELDIVMKDLSKKYDIHGRPRKTGSPKDQSRQNVKNLFKNALAKIKNKANLPQMAVKS